MNEKKIFIILKWLFVLVIFVVAFLSMPIFFEKLILWLIDKKIICEGSDSNYVNFYATILSGLFTLVGVVITIKYEDRIRKEEESILYKPILVIDDINIKKSGYLRDVGLGMEFFSSFSDPNKNFKYEEFLKQQDNNNSKYKVFIKNNGRGETFNTVLENFELVNVNWDDKINLYSKYSSNQYIGEILKEDSFGIVVHLPNFLFMPERPDSQKWYELRTNTYISYSDMFNRIKYQLCIHTVHKVIIENFEDEQPYLYKDGYKYAKVRYEIMYFIPKMSIYSFKHKKYISEKSYTLEKIKDSRF